MTRVVVGWGTCGVAAGAEATWKALQGAPHLSRTGCVGMCYEEPLVEVREDGGKTWLYGKVTPERAARILEEHVRGGTPVQEFLVDGSEFLARQTRIALRNCGRIDPESLDEAVAAGAYEALRQVLQQDDPEALIQAVVDSGLRGRGGAGFLTGLKWRFARMAQGDRKFVICNADEGDPGAFMDRSVLEGDVHSVLEGMAIAAFAIGAREGYVYARAEYPMAVHRLKIAIAQAEARGFLGDGILGTPFSFHVKLKEGAGAFVCGEETALIASIEGRRGMPRVRPPFPAVRGLWDGPTCINNVETLANVPWIVSQGPRAFAAYGTATSKGTKVFAMAGKVKRGGLVEVPMGLTIRELVHGVCGGIKEDRPFKAVQMGGPSGGCIPAELQDTPIDYESIQRTGAIMGSGGLVVMDDTTCMVEVARFFLEFTQRESCGKCTFCRIGTKRMLEVLTRITEGEGKEGDLDLLQELADRVRATTLCGLGQTAPNPVLTTLRYFRAEYEAHIHTKRCPAHHCPRLVTYVITDDCSGCQVCKKACPTGAITGEKKQIHVIDPTKCTVCGECYKACRLSAVRKE